MINNAGTPEPALVYVRQDDLAALQSEVRSLKGFVDFVNLWCTRDNVTDEERVSVIKHHPTASERRKPLVVEKQTGAE